MSSEVIFTNAIQTDGIYGINTLLAVTRAANKTYDLYDRVIMDDGKVTIEDATDALLLGPDIFREVQLIVSKRAEIGKEITDLSENEKARLKAAAGERLNNSGYLKIFDGILQIIDGVSELANGANPVG